MVLRGFVEVGAFAAVEVSVGEDVVERSVVGVGYEGGEVRVEVVVQQTGLKR